MQSVQTDSVAYIGLGANLGDRLATLRAAVEHLARLGRIVTTSSIYQTDPVGYLDQPAFLNAVVAVATTLEPGDLVPALLAIERDLGRVRSFRNAPRALDLDLLLYGEQVVETITVTVPHPRLHERAFVLVPLREIGAEHMHPVLGVTVGTLHDRLGPIEGVRRTPDALIEENKTRQSRVDVRSR